MAIKLQRVLEGGRVNIDLNQVPKDQHYVDPQAKYHKCQLTEVFPEIYLIKVNNQWVYSEETAQSIEVLSQKLYPLGIKKLDKILPHTLRKSFLGIHLWQHVLLMLLFLFAAGFYKAFTYFLERCSHLFLTQWITSQVLALKRFIGFVAALWMLMAALPIIQLPAALEQSTIRLLKGALAIAITASCYAWVDIISLKVLEKPSRSRKKKNKRLTGQLILLAKPFMKVLVVLVGTLLTLSLLNFNISHMLAGISIGGIGFALASQDTIKNFYGMLNIFIDQPFRVGDTIASGNIKGIVKEIGLRATRIRTYHQSITYIPNAKLIETHIDNYGLVKYQPVEAHIAIAYETDPALIETFLEGLRKIAERHACIREDAYAIHLKNMHNATLTILFRVYCDTHNRNKGLSCSERIWSAITQLVEKSGTALVALNLSTA